MGAKLVELKTGRDLVVDDVVRTLESLLEEARDGKIVSIAAGFVRRSGEINTTHSATDSVGILLGAVALAQVRLARDCEED